MQENFRVRRKKLYFGFVDLEKAFDRIPTEVITWAHGQCITWELKNGWYQQSCLCTQVQKVDMHQGSALSPLLFVIVMDAISREFRVALPWELLYADDLADS